MLIETRYPNRRHGYDFLCFILMNLMNYYQDCDSYHLYLERMFQISIFEWMGIDNVKTTLWDWDHVVKVAISSVLDCLFTI